MEVKYRTHHRNILQAILTDDQGHRWVWSKPIYKRTATHQGPMGMLGPTHDTKAYDVEGYGTVPENLKHDTRTANYIRERFIKHPEEFEPYYSIAEEKKHLGHTYRRQT